MKFNVKVLFPHLVALGIFLVVTLIFCKPALEGKVLAQHDMVQWTAMSKDADNHKAAFGQYPQWTQGLFSGMPSFLIAFNSNNAIPWYVGKVMGLFLPEPFAYFLVACIAFYLLGMVLRVKPWIAIAGALLFAFATYNPVIISAGHHTKMYSIGMMPALLAGIILIFQKKYWLGFGITALFSGALVAMNHLQITYYMFLVLGIMAIWALVSWIRQKEFKHLLIAASLSIVAVVMGVASNAVVLLSTYDYSKATIRGGSALTAPADNGTTSAKSAAGLDSSYAMSYSMSIAEPLVMVVPRLFGGGSSQPLPEDGNVMETVSNYPALRQSDIIYNLSMYWGGIGGTSGPPYSGAIVFFLALFGMFILDNRYKWWMLGAILLAVMMSWGGYFWELNGTLLKYLPFYNKFRAPSMILVIPQLLLPILAMLTLQKLSDENFDKKAEWPRIKNGLIGVGVFALFLLGFYFMSDFYSPTDRQLLKQIAGIEDANTQQVYKALWQALANDRKYLAFSDIMRTFGFVIVAGLLLFAMARKVLKPVIAVSLVGLLAFVDLVTVGSKYLNEEVYVEAEKDENGKIIYPELFPTAANQAIAQDKGIYRVYDARQYKTINGQRAGVNPFADVSQAYHHNMVSGYHAAKLSIYQDLIEQQISKGNPVVFNMLNTKYFLVNGTRGDSVAFNPQALGPAWLVKSLVKVNSAKEEMDALDSLNVENEAVVNAVFSEKLQLNPMWDSTASIKVKEYTNDKLVYELYAPTEQFAVLSEIYYDRGWEATIDGKPAEIVKTNYVLRGVKIPGGSNEMVMEFKPKAYTTGKMITSITQWLLLVILGLGIWMHLKGKEG